MKAGGRGRSIAISLVVTVVVGLVMFFFRLPALNLQNPGFYTFIFTLSAIFCVLSSLLMGIFRDNTGIGIWHAIKKNCIVPVIICALLLVLLVAGNILSSPIFRASSYRDLLEVDTGDFAADVEQISFDQIPMLDEDSAERLGDRKMGELSDLVSQFEVSDAYTQINYLGRPVRVTYLEYGDFFKWFNNRSEGLPAYITVDMVTQEASVVRLSELGLGGMRYSPSELFFRKLDRHLRFNYPTYMFSEPTFEIDEDGTPWWICPKIEKKIGLFGGTDINGAVLVNAITGECTYYEDVPSWCDRVYLASLIMEQYDYHGTYVNGFWNSIFGQKDVTVTTDGYNYIALGDDVYMYTGVTSVSGDQSNIGFLLSNQRTKETKYYSAPGAVERSAQYSAQGVVQDLGYTATFPLLLNVAGEPTYFMSLKDASELVKQYAMVNVAQYQIVATGTTVAQCEENYLKLLMTQGITEQEEIQQTEFEGVIQDIRAAVLDGNTRYYIMLEGDHFYYVIDLASAELAAVLDVGDEIIISASDSEGELRTAYSLRRAD